MKTTIEMAREAGFTEGELAFMVDNFRQFAELVRADERGWVGLTDEDIEQVWRQVQTNDFHDCVQPFARAIEAKLKGNT